MKVLDLFSGIGGFSLGLERAGMQTVAFCEIDPFCQKVLKKHWPDVPIFEDVRSLDYDGRIDVISGGFPCQPFSVAGKQKGAEDDRHLWPAMFSLIQKYRPRWVIGENVAGLINMGLDDVLADLESEAYTARTFVIPACAVNAPHRRDRVWIVANAHGSRRREGDKEMARRPSEQSDSLCIQSFEADSDAVRNGLQRCAEKQISREPHIQGELVRRGETIAIVRDSCKSEVLGITNGFSGRVDRIKAIGNAVVPQIPEMIGRAIMEIEKT